MPEISTFLSASLMKFEIPKMKKSIFENRPHVNRYNGQLGLYRFQVENNFKGKIQLINYLSWINQLS